MTIYLYLKTHNVTGLKYLGQTSQNPCEYKGSGKYWKRHIEKHGYNVTTEILLETNDKIELKKYGNYYSNLWNIVESNEFANLINECGTGGNTLPNGHSNEARKKISLAHKGKKLTKNHLKTMTKKVSGLNSSVKKSVCANGKIYPMVKMAAESLNVSRTTILNRIKNDNFPNYYYVTN